LKAHYEAVETSHKRRHNGKKLYDLTTLNLEISRYSRNDVMSVVSNVHETSHQKKQ